MTSPLLDPQAIDPAAEYRSTATKTFAVLRDRTLNGLRQALAHVTDCANSEPDIFGAMVLATVGGGTTCYGRRVEWLRRSSPDRNPPTSSEALLPALLLETAAQETLNAVMRDSLAGSEGTLVLILIKGHVEVLGLAQHQNLSAVDFVDALPEGFAGAFAPVNLGIVPCPSTFQMLRNLENEAADTLNELARLILRDFPDPETAVPDDEVFEGDPACCSQLIALHEAYLASPEGQEAPPRAVGATFDPRYTLPVEQAAS